MTPPQASEAAVGGHAMTAQAGAVAVVPTEPTLWMLEQLSNALYEDIRLVGRRERFRKGYAAMLAAAPTPPAAVPVEALEGLAAEWEAEAAALLGKSKRAANHVAAGGLNTRAAQLRKLIKERGNG